MTYTKRFQVMDIYYSETPTVKEWIDAQKQFPDVRSGAYRVKLDNNDEVTAYFFSDRNLMPFEPPENGSFWWSQKRTPLNNVTHWGKPIDNFDDNKE